MKKLTILSTILFSAVLILSCSKEAVRQPTVTGSSVITTDPGPAVKAVSKWFSPAFDVVNDRTSIYLVAHQDHETNLSYDGTTHVEFAYVKLNSHGTILTRRLPAILSDPNSQGNTNKISEINFGLNNYGCTVTIRNADRNTIPSIITVNPFPDMQVRYIVISKALFSSLNINWDDYAAVATALNI